MNAKELYEAYDRGNGKDVILHFTYGELTERKIMSISIRRATDRLKYVNVYSFRFEDGNLIMYAEVSTILFNLFMNPEFEEDE